MEKLCSWKFRFEKSFEILEYFQNVLSLDGFSQNYHTHDLNNDIFILDGRIKNLLNNLSKILIRY